MKTFQEVQAVLRLELIHWFPIQVREEYEDFYLYYQPSMVGQSGALIICRGNPQPNKYELAGRVRKDLTIDQNFKIFSDICWRLPLLDI